MAGSPHHATSRNTSESDRRTEPAGQPEVTPERVTSGALRPETVVEHHLFGEM